MDYTDQITTLRQTRENLINKFRNASGQGDEIFNYFPIDQKWKIPASLTIRKPKEGMKDYEIQYVRIGKIDLNFGNSNEQKFTLYQVEGEEEKYYMYIKDGTSGKTSYGLGRFVPVLKEDESYFAEFNLAATPACGHVEGSACPWAREVTGIAIEAGEKADSSGH